jgi:surface carbohydrate biosynthesis protein
MSSPIGIVFPVETINRELDYRLWLACVAAKPGRRIIIAQHDVAYALTDRMRNGVYVGKNVFMSRFPFGTERYASVKERGFTLVHVDEEGLCPGKSRDIWARALDARLDPSILAREDFACTWGTAQHDHYKPKHVDPQKVVITGHPRFDLLKEKQREFYASDTASIRARFGDFVLINTNLVHANNGLGLADSFTNIVHDYDPKDPVSRLNHFNGWALQSHLLANLVKLVNRLSVEFPETNFVIRPHPSEEWSYYRTIFNGIPNVHVVHEGNVVPWLFACRVLIHDACTTAIEAHFCGRPVINYRSFEPKNAWTDDFWLPAIFGARCTHEDEVVALMRDLDGARAATTEARFNDDAYALMENFRADGALEKVARTIDDACDGLTKKPELPSQWSIRVAEEVRLAEDRARGVVRPLFPAKHARAKALRAFFPGLDREKIDSKLRTIRRLTGRSFQRSFMGDSILTIEAS